MVNDDKNLTTRLIAKKAGQKIAIRSPRSRCVTRMMHGRRSSASREPIEAAKPTA
jgi:hypothetical protein